MSQSNAIERLKELQAHYEDCMIKESRIKRIDANMRLRIKKIRKETLNEMLTLIKGLD